MAESENDRWIQSASNGVLTDFTYDFDVESSSELLIIHYDSTAEEERTNDPAEATPFVEDVDYTVDTGTKTVSFTTAPATGTVTIIGDTDFSNNFSQTDSQPVNTSALNTVNNRHTRAIQQLWTMARQSLRFARRSTLRDKVFPDFSSADDGKSLQVNSVGKLVFGAISEFTGYTLTTIGQNIIEAADASAVRTLLSLYTSAEVDTLDAANIKKDGSVPFTGDQSMGGLKLTGSAAGSADTDLPILSQVKFSGARVYFLDSQSLGAGLTGKISFGGEIFDEGDYFDVGSPTRLTAAGTGYHRLTLALPITYTSAYSDGVDVEVLVNGASLVPVLKALPASNNGAITKTTFTLNALLHLTAGDYVEFQVTNSLGVAIGYSDSSSRAVFADIQREKV